MIGKTPYEVLAQTRDAFCFDILRALTPDGFDAFASVRAGIDDTTYRVVSFSPPVNTIVDQYRQLTLNTQTH